MEYNKKTEIAFNQCEQIADQCFFIFYQVIEAYRPTPSKIVLALGVKTFPKLFHLYNKQAHGTFVFFEKAHSNTHLTTE